METPVFINELKHIRLTNGQELSYQHFGRDYLSAPVVVVNHPLTANSSVAGENGWWNDIIGENKTIDTTQYARTLNRRRNPQQLIEWLLLDSNELR